MSKVYERTEDGTTVQISLREGLDEINHAQMTGRRDVRTMSSLTRTDFVIEYKDGRKVRLAQVDATRSGHTPCACRDCMDTTVSSDVNSPELCGLCEEAGCEPLPVQPFPGMLTMFECQRDDAYEG